MSHLVVEQDIKNIAAALTDEARDLSGSTLVITGGAGFLGSYILAVMQELNRSVLASPCRVVAVDNYLTGSKGNLIMEITDPHITYVTADVRQPLNLPTKADYLIHAAGVASPVYYKKFPLDTIEGTVLGVKHMLEYARENGAKSVLYFSSSEIYGDPDPNFVPTPETYKGNVSSIGPRSCYDESKRLGETYCMAYHTLFRTPVKIVRPFNVYGPGMKPNDYRVIPNFMMHGLQGKALPVHDKGNQTRTFCYISDAVTGFFKVLLRGRSGEAYNIGNDQEEINMLALAEKVSVAIGGGVRPILIQYPEAYPIDEPNRRCPNLTKAKSELGYAARVDLSSGIARTYEWFKDTTTAGV